MEIILLLINEIANEFILAQIYNRKNLFSVSYLIIVRTSKYIAILTRTKIILVIAIDRLFSFLYKLINANKTLSVGRTIGNPSDWEILIKGISGRIDRITKGNATMESGCDSAS